MKTNWDYTNLADAYLKRPDYSEEAINTMLKTTGISKDAKICDVGAGVAHLTLMLLERGYNVVAVEPNDAMRANGILRTKKYNHSAWLEGTGENTGQPTGTFDMVTFGSSFNVCDRQEALKETKRILKPGGWFACMWNHRDVNDNIQAAIENIIKSEIKDYGYGTRREDQTEEINKSGLFKEVKKIEGSVIHVQTIAECVEAWRSHATLERQAGEKFTTIISKIETYLNGLNVNEIKIPYTTRIWMAQLK
jgi:ubiquinone/menaquinone biosynthesis C-methylase UbiE